jgi:hypothetical protein
MPTYDFINTNTGEEWEEFMSIADMESLLEGNPEIKTAWKTAPAIAGDHIMGVGPKTDGGFNERMEQIANSHPGSPLANRYGGSKIKSHREIKTRDVLKKHRVI